MGWFSPCCGNCKKPEPPPCPDPCPPLQPVVPGNWRIDSPGFTNGPQASCPAPNDPATLLSTTWTGNALTTDNPTPVDCTGADCQGSIDFNTQLSQFRNDCGGICTNLGFAIGLYSAFAKVCGFGVNVQITIEIVLNTNVGGLQDFERHFFEVTTTLPQSCVYDVTVPFDRSIQPCAGGLLAVPPSSVRFYIV